MYRIYFTFLFTLFSFLFIFLQRSRAEDHKDFKGKYFVVINIASETLRLYERICMGKICMNKMLLETETVVGEDKSNPKEAPGKGRSIVGSYRLVEWKKFYETSDGHYPAWYNENYPPVPPPGKNPSLWFSEKYMPVESDGRKHGKMRGAFGWYTALIMPNAYGQWIHGTMGWGQDKDYYIQMTKSILPNILFDPRSSGCIRNNNEAIAYLRHFLNIGTPIIKVYAQEKVYDPTSPMYKEKTGTWDYVLTKTSLQLTERAAVLESLGSNSAELDVYWKAKKLSSGILLDRDDPLNEILEVGTYQMDIYPNAMEFIPGEKLPRTGRKIIRSGNIYGIKSKDMSGVFFVDTGILFNYHHPKSTVEVSGFKDEETPPWMRKN